MQEVSVDRLIALVALAGTYLGLALGRLPFFRVDRTGVAIIGGAIVVVSGLLPWDRAVAAVDAHTLVLLFGMMIVAAYLRLSGFFRLVTYAAVRRAHTPVGLLALIIVAAGVLSALFVNDVVCLVMAPIVLDLVRRLQLPPAPYPAPIPAQASGWDSGARYPARWESQKVTTVIFRNRGARRAPEIPLAHTVGGFPVWKRDGLSA